MNIAAFANNEYKEVGKFNCKSSSSLFPYETPATIATLILEAKVSTKEYDLSNRVEMSKLDLTMAYAIRKQNESNILEQGFVKSFSTRAVDLPFYPTNYNDVSYKVRVRTNTNSTREIYLSIPDRFYNSRRFGITAYFGEFNYRDSGATHFSCRMLN